MNSKKTLTAAARWLSDITEINPETQSEVSMKRNEKIFDYKPGYCIKVGLKRWLGGIDRGDEVPLNPGRLGRTGIACGKIP